MMTVPIFGEPVTSSVNLPWHVDCTNLIWRISNLHCKTSVARLMAQSYLVNRIAYCIQQFFMRFVVCGERNAILLVYHTDLLLVWGSLRLTPTIGRLVPKEYIGIGIEVGIYRHSRLVDSV